MKIYLALPEVHRVEPRELSHTRRPVHEIELWHEPDVKPTFSFSLRPRLIQEGVGCKLVCCVNGKPQPKVIQIENLFVLRGVSSID